MGLPPWADTRTAEQLDIPPADVRTYVTEHSYCMPGENCQFMATRTMQFPVGRALDFAAVTDHAEQLGESNICTFEATEICAGDQDCDPVVTGQECSLDQMCRPNRFLIALTILILAVELTRAGRGHETLIPRFPWAMAFTFGLLHGLGFAGALTEIGLPANEVPLALAVFNIGIAVGQLLCVAAILMLAALLRRVRAPLPTTIQKTPSYAIGSLAVFWILDRTAAMFSPFSWPSL